jgi:hypothetical protein
MNKRVFGASQIATAMAILFFTGFYADAKTSKPPHPALRTKRLSPGSLKARLNG